MSNISIREMIDAGVHFGHQSNIGTQKCARSFILRTKNFT